MDLKVRVGDLTGLSQTRLLGTNPNDAGFGMYAKNVFLEGGITANTGSIGGIEMQSNKLFNLNSGTSPTFNNANTNFYLDNSGNFSLRDKLSFNSTTGVLNVDGTITVGSLPDVGIVSGSAQIASDISGSSTTLSSSLAASASSAVGTGSLLTTSASSAAATSSTLTTASSSAANVLRLTTSGVDIFEIDGTATKVASYGPTTTIGDTSGEHISISPSAFEIKTSSTNTVLSASSAGLEMSGSIKAGSGEIGGFTIDEHSLTTTGVEINDSTQTLFINTSNFDVSHAGDVTASNVDLSGKITATTGSFSGLLNVGNLATADDVADTSTGFRVDANGNALIKQGGANADYIQFSSGSLNIKTSDTFVLDAIDGSNKGIKIDSSTPSIIIQSGSGATQGKITLTSAPGAGVGNTDAASLVVSQSGQPIFSVGGEDFSFTSTQNLIVNSFPIEDDDVLAPGDSVADFSVPATQNSFDNSSDTNTNTAGGGAPTVKVANLLVASQMSASRFRAGKSLYLKNTANEASSRTTFNVSVLDQQASGSATNSPAIAGFDIKRNYDTFTTNDQIPQATVFSSVISSSLDQGAASPKFVPNGAPSGSATFHFQSLLREGSAGGPTFHDGKKCVVRIDSDVYQSGAPENEFVFIEGRAASGSYTTPTTIWQIQSDGHFVTRGNITGFGVNADFNTVSDKRFKKDIHTISGSMNKILQLRPTEFTWIEQEKQDVGFIAQEVEEIIPEIINTTRGMIEDEKETEEMKTISYQKFVPYLVDTIQQLNKRIEELEKKVK